MWRRFRDRHLARFFRFDPAGRDSRDDRDVPAPPGPGAERRGRAPPPVEGPDVRFGLMLQMEVKAAGARAIADRRGRPWVLGNQGRVHMLLAAHALTKIEKVYGSVFESILGEKVTTKPVQVVTPFSWRVATRVTK